MPPVESLVLEAAVLDNFSDPLDDFTRKLVEIDAKAAETFPIDVDVRGVATAVTQLEAVAEAARRADDVGVDIDSDIADSDVDADESAVPTPPSSPSQTAVEAALESASVDRLDVDDIRTSGGIDLREMFAKAERRGELSDLFPEGSLIENLGGDFPSEVRATEAGLPVLRGVDMETKREFFEIDTSLQTAMEMPDALGFGDDDGFGDLMEEFRNLQFTSGSFHQTLASIIPLLLTFVGALPAAVAGLASLGAAAIAAAGALLGITGLAIGGLAIEDGELDFSEIQERIRSLGETALEEFELAARRLEPLAESAFASAEGLLENLGRRAEAFDRHTDEIRGAFDYLERTVPEVLDKIVAFGAAAMPALGVVDQFLANLNVIQSLSDVLAETLGLTIGLVNAIVNLIGPLISLSRGFLMTSAFILTAFSAMLQLFDIIPYGLELFGVLLSVLLGLVTMTSLYTLATNSALVATLEFVGGILTSAIPSLNSLTTAITTATAMEWAFYAATAAVLGLLTLGLAPVIGGIASQFGAMNDNIQSATDSLREFSAVSDSLEGTAVGVGTNTRRDQRGGRSGYQSASTMVVAPDKETGNAVANTIEFTGSGMGNDTVAQSEKRDRMHNE